jgi:subtilisin family serine protease
MGTAPSFSPGRRAAAKALKSLIGVLGLAVSLAAQSPAHVPGRLLVGRRDAMDADLLTAIWRQHGAVERRRVTPLGLHVIEAPEASIEAIRQSLVRTALFDYVEPDYYAEVAATSPNDPSYLAQWHLPKIGSSDAWTRTTGSASVVVAVVDSGVYAAHPDLAPKLIAGWNFVKSNADTADVIGHGTEVAGTVAAATNNGIGVAGVSWGSLVMPLVVVDNTNFAAYSDIAAAIQYAVDRNIRVINVSIGGASPSSVLQSAVDYAWSRNALVFAAAMNNGQATPYYPAACLHAVAVSATTEQDRLVSFSNYGSWITLSAPGTDILTTMNGGGYGYVNGTSFAAPIAAGVAALALAVNPHLSNQEVLSALKQSADAIGAPGFDPQFGWGRVNSGKAVALVSPAPPPVAAPPAPAPVASPDPAPAPSEPRTHPPFRWADRLRD